MSWPRLIFIASAHSVMIRELARIHVFARKTVSTVIVGLLIISYSWPPLLTRLVKIKRKEISQPTSINCRPRNCKIFGGGKARPIFLLRNWLQRKENPLPPKNPARRRLLSHLVLLFAEEIKALDDKMDRATLTT